MRSGKAVDADGTGKIVGLDLRVGWKAVGSSHLGSGGMWRLDWRPRKEEEQHLKRHDDDVCLLKKHDLHE